MKYLKALTVISMIFCVGFFVLLFLCITRTPEFGALVVDVHADITSEFGHTVAGMYNRLTPIVFYCLAACFVVNQIVILSMVNCRKDDEEEDEVEEVVEDIPQVASTRVLYSAPTSTVATKKEKVTKVKKTKTEKDKAIDAVQKTLETANTKVNTTVETMNEKNKALNDFLESLRRK